MRQTERSIDRRRVRGAVAKIDAKVLAPPPSKGWCNNPHREEDFMRLRGRVLMAAASAAFLSACADPSDNSPPEDVQSTQSALNQTFAQHQTACQADPRVQAGIVSLTDCIGADIFFRENFNGNGRTCGTCHRVERNFTIDATFMSRLPNSDPLFIAENQSDGLSLDGLEIPAQMRARGLILENLDGTQPEGPTVRFVLRAVPHNLSMGTSTTRPPGSDNPPAERTGWSGDGAPGQGRLADFTNGAINQHFTRSLNRVPGTDFRVATEQEGQAVASFMRDLGRLNDIDLGSITFSDAGAETGRQRFLVVGCNGCHGNASANINGGGGNQNFNTGVESVRNRNLVNFPSDGGFGVPPGISPPSAIGNGTFNVPPLIEAADTGPFFHTDTEVIGSPAENTESAQTIEQAVAFYGSVAFNLGINATDIANIARFLRSLNAIFNIQMASNRIIGARNMGNVLGNVARVDRMQRRLAQMTLFELDDAVRVLSGVANLNTAQADRVRTARSRIETVVATPGTSTAAFNTRMTNLANAFNDLDLADGEISGNVMFNIGNATRIDCADPSTDTQPGNAPCFDPTLRTAAP
jgi:cytochrome c peroxidase